MFNDGGLGYFQTYLAGRYMVFVQFFQDIVGKVTLINGYGRQIDGA